ncbi:MAG: biotin synthetase [Bdellovibrionaceae bacterium]|nr:biotin synthetase [Pseudobdellovibrionaceae bacterium]
MSFSVFVATQNWAHTSQIAAHSQPSVTSTNDWAKESAFRAGQADFEVFIADHQSAGRGRGANIWQDAAPGDLLLSSWSFQLSAPPQPVLAPALGLSLFRAMVTTWPDLPFSLKAPNDLYLGDKKLAGILLENVQQGDKTRLIFGLGLNVFNKPDLPTATCLAEGLSLDRVNELGWNLFLDRLWLELVSALRETKATLSPNQCASLRYALNRNPNLTAPYDAVTPEGSLIVAGGEKIDWSTL